MGAGSRLSCSSLFSLTWGFPNPSCTLGGVPGPAQPLAGLVLPRPSVCLPRAPSFSDRSGVVTRPGPVSSANLGVAGKECAASLWGSPPLAHLPRCTDCSEAPGEGGVASLSGAIPHTFPALNEACAGWTLPLRKQRGGNPTYQPVRPTNVWEPPGALMSEEETKARRRFRPCPGLWRS